MSADDPRCDTLWNEIHAAQDRIRAKIGIEPPVEMPDQDEPDEPQEGDDE